MHAPPMRDTEELLQLGAFRLRHRRVRNPVAQILPLQPNQRPRRPEPDFEGITAIPLLPDRQSRHFLR